MFAAASSMPPKDWDASELDGAEYPSLEAMEAYLKEMIPSRHTDIVSGTSWTLSHDPRWMATPLGLLPDNFVSGAVELDPLPPHKRRRLDKTSVSSQRKQEGVFNAENTPLGTESISLL